MQSFCLSRGVGFVKNFVYFETCPSIISFLHNLVKLAMSLIFKIVHKYFKSNIDKKCAIVKKSLKMLDKPL